MSSYTNWDAANDNRIIPPEGFHLPTNEDWLTLIHYLGVLYMADGKLTVTGTSPRDIFRMVVPPTKPVFRYSPLVG